MLSNAVRPMWQKVLKDYDYRDDPRHRTANSFRCLVFLQLDSESRLRVPILLPESLNNNE